MTLGWMEFNEPFLFPLFQSLEIFLQLLTIIHVGYSQINNCVISEQPNPRVLSVLGHVVYVHQEKNWSKNRSLGHSTRDWYSIRFFAIDHNLLCSQGQERLDPCTGLGVDTGTINFVQESIMGDFVKRFAEIHDYDVTLFAVSEGL